MIISCEKCDTKYRLDSSRVSYAPVKVQCSKCGHVFIVPAAGGRGEAALPTAAPSSPAEERPGGGGSEAGSGTGPLDQGPETGPTGLTGGGGPEEGPSLSGEEEERGQEGPIGAEGPEEKAPGPPEPEEGPGPDAVTGGKATEEGLGEEGEGCAPVDERFSFNPDLKGLEELGGGQAELGAQAGDEGGEGAEDTEPDERSAEESAGTDETAKDDGTAEEGSDIYNGSDLTVESKGGEVTASAGMREEDEEEGRLVGDDLAAMEGAPQDRGPAKATETTEEDSSSEDVDGAGSPLQAASPAEDSGTEDGPAPLMGEGEEGAQRERTNDLEPTFETDAFSFETPESEEESGERSAEAAPEGHGGQEGPDDEGPARPDEGAGNQDEFKFDLYDGDIAYEEPGLGMKEEWAPIPEGPWSGNNEASEKTGSGEAGTSVPEAPKDKEEKTNKPPEDSSASGADEKPSSGEQPSFDSEFMKAVFGDKAEKDGEAEGGTEETEEEKESKTFVIPEVPPEVERIKGSGVARAVAIVIIVLAIAGGAIYLKTRPESPMMTEPSAARTIKIESTRGYYVVNREGTRIFVIETMVRNISDGPVRIGGIRGLVMDSSGHEMARKTVSPGRIVSSDDLKNLPVETLLASFRDTSEGTMPKRAVIPTMVIFTDLPAGVAEYGIDVLR